MRDTIEWRDSQGGSMGPKKLLMVRNDYVGHLYVDASEGVNAAQVLEDIETRYNLYANLVSSLQSVAALGDPNDMTAAAVREWAQAAAKTAGAALANVPTYDKHSQN